MADVRTTGLDQGLDIWGSSQTNDQLVVGDEGFGWGELTGVGGNAGIITVSGGIVTFVDGSANFVLPPDQFLQIIDSVNPINNGVFLITAIIDSVTLQYNNVVAVNSTAVSWDIRNPYSLQSDLNYIRTDRRLIKGTTTWHDPIPSYHQTTATGTAIPTNLSNVAGKTLDAHNLIASQIIRGVSVSVGATHVILSYPGNLKHASTIDRTGIPCFDTAPYTGMFEECFAILTDSNGNEFNDSVTGHLVFGVTQASATTSPDTVDIVFYSVVPGADISTATAYTWTATDPAIIAITYGYGYRMDQLPEAAFRRVLTLGLMSDISTTAINNLQSVVGVGSSNTSLAGLLTNTGNYYPFSGLSITPTVVAALNILNQDIGNLTFTGSTLTSGSTITSALQALSNAIGGGRSSLVRVIDRRATPILKFTNYTLPTGISGFTPDISGNGGTLYVWVRGRFLDPGIVDGDEYTEINSTTLQFGFNINVGDHINLVRIRNTQRYENIV